MENILETYFSKTQILNIKPSPGMLNLYDGDLRIAYLHHKKHENRSYEFHTTVLDKPRDTHQLIFTYLDLVPKNSTIHTSALNSTMEYILLQLGFKRTEAFAKYMTQVDFKIPYEAAAVKFTGDFTHTLTKR